METIKKALFFSMVVFLAACDKEDENPGNAMSSEEAAELVAASLADGSAGASASMMASVEITNEAMEAETGGRTAACGFSEDSAFSVSNAGSSLITFDYDFFYNYQLSCTEQNTPDNIEFLVSYDGSFESPRFVSTNTGSASWTMDGLALSETVYVLNGAYYRNGSFQSKVRNQNATVSTIEFALTNVTLNKGTYVVESGSATVTVSGTLVGKGVFNVAGTVVFLGNGEASVTISGEKYIIDLESGEIEEA